MDKYKEIRPYNDDEVRDAMKRVAKNPKIATISKVLYPNQDADMLVKMIASIQSVEEFQSKIMYPAVKTILDKTASNLTISGLENVSSDSKHLFISNHRDIVLDSSIIQLAFMDHGLDTTKLAIGDNLIQEPFMADIARSNKMLTVKRYTNPREMYISSVLLSEYIREDVSMGRSSVWIAQRNGRTKDGNDMTEQGLLKMFDMSGSGNFISDFDKLAIIPVSISYEYEPCDILKAVELYFSQNGKYEKLPGEDLKSIITGILQFKGAIHLHFSPRIAMGKIKSCSEYGKNEKFKNLAEMIDQDIISNYKLWKNNYIAYDIMYSTDKYSKFYTDQEKVGFVKYIDGLIDSISDKSLEKERIRKTLYNMYGNPTLNKEKLNIL